MRKWVVFVAVYFAGIVVVINQFKVPPVMQALMTELHLSPVMAGWTMSIFSFTGIVLAIPAAWLLGKLHSKLSGLIGLGCSVLGCVIGALAGTPESLLIGRVIEGLGMGLIGVIAPSVIAMYFNHSELGLPMGIWSSWVGIGSTVAFSVGLPIQNAFTWRGFWWFGAILSLLAFVLYAVIVRDPERIPDAAASAKPAAIRIPYAEGFKTPGVWLLGLVFFAMVFCFASLATWIPQYFIRVLGTSPAAANSYVTVRFVASIVGGLISGYIMTKVPNHKGLLIIFMVGAGIVYAFTFSMSLGMVIPLMIIGGMFSDAVAVAVFTMAPNAMPTPVLGGLALGLVSMLQYIAFLMGPPIIGKAISGGNWNTANYPLWIVMIGGVVVTIAFAILKPAKKHSIA